MHIEKLVLSNFQCFGSDTTTIFLDSGFTAFVGANGSGKTAAFTALARLFGVTRDERQVRVEDFHVPVGEEGVPETRDLHIEVIIGFPELSEEDDEAVEDSKDEVVSEFFRQMAATIDGQMKCRFRLDAKWTSDGSMDGTIAETLRVVHTFDDEFSEDDCTPLRPADRTRIQMVYVPASRDGARHVSAFLRSRLWKAAQWSDSLRAKVEGAAADVDEQFRAEPVVATIEGAVRRRWGDLHRSDLFADPTFRLVEGELTQLVNNAQLLFAPTETGIDRRVEQLSDGQRSLLHIALTAATLDVEHTIAEGTQSDEFDADLARLPSLTLLVVEEPENSLSPHYLSRIVDQMKSVGAGDKAQALASSQSASALRRVDPRAVRHFRLDLESRSALVRPLDLPDDENDRATYVREAVQAFPELYFARLVILGEGGSEEVVIPRLAEAAGTMIDQSFVAVVPLGGRHVNHFWRLLSGLGIPYVTLLDLDWGRSGGREGRLRDACRELSNIGIDVPFEVDGIDDVDDIAELSDREFEDLISALQGHGVYYCDPLDLDMTMLEAFPAAYHKLAEGLPGPDDSPAFDAVLGKAGDAEVYGDWDEEMRWYRYLFLGRSKPSTHLRALAMLDDAEIRSGTPAPLSELIARIAEAVD